MSQARRAVMSVIMAIVILAWIIIVGLEFSRPINYKCTRYETTYTEHGDAIKYCVDAKR